MTAAMTTLSASPDRSNPEATWLPATPGSSLPSAIASLARLDRADLRFEIADRTPEEIGAMAEHVEAALADHAPAIGVDNVLTGIEKLATRFSLELPDADVLEADVLEMAGWPAETWIAGFRGVWSSFRSGFRRFPTVADFRAAAAGSEADDRTQAALRRLAVTLRQEQHIRAREIAFRRRQKEREAAAARRQEEMTRRIAAPSQPMPQSTAPAPSSSRAAPASKAMANTLDSQVNSTGEDRHTLVCHPTVLPVGSKKVLKKHANRGNRVINESVRIGNTSIPAAEPWQYSGPKPYFQAEFSRTDQFSVAVHRRAAQDSNNGLYRKHPGTTPYAGRQGPT